MRTLDVAPLDDRELERGVEEVRGDIRSERDVRAPRRRRRRRRARGGGAADPVVPRRRSAPSTSRARRTCSPRALEAGVRRVVLISSTAVYGVPERHPIDEDDPLVGVGWYGESKIEAEQLAGEFGRRGLDVVIVRPKTFIGPERLGVFEILFDWIREGRRIPILGDGAQPLPAARGRGPRRRRRPLLRRAGRRRGAERRRRRRSAPSATTCRR